MCNQTIEFRKVDSNSQLCALISTSKQGRREIERLKTIQRHINAKAKVALGYSSLGANR
jgi:hypothetical protein